MLLPRLMFMGLYVRKEDVLTQAGKEIKNREEILALSLAIWLPKRVAVVHCKGHQKADSPEARGNWVATLDTQEVALEPVGPL